ncbi:MAG: hypothetical protein NTY91_04750 [Euryarchaeota archaeon]|nr:hypothetical protein [Euryarchaeota archaeon]
MVRERKTRVKDIEKLHELIDSASLPKHRTVSSYDAEKLDSLRKRLSDDSLKDLKQTGSSHDMLTTSGGLQPQVVVHKQEEPQKKNEKVIQIDLGPKSIKKEKEHPMVDFLPVKEDPFAREPLFEIEKASVPKKVSREVRPKTLLKKTQVPKEFVPVISDQKEKEEALPEFQPVSKEPIIIEPSVRRQGTLTKEVAQKAEPIKEGKKGLLSFLHAQKNEIPSFEPVEFQAMATDKKEPMRFEMQKKAPEDRKQKKIEEKIAKKDGKEKEKEAKHLSKEKEKKLKIETVETQQKQQEEQRKKDVELKQAFAQAEEKEREEQRLQKEQEKKSRLEVIERQKKEKEDRKQKKIDEKKARLEITEKKLEAKRLAKEHDRKLKLEWIEFQHKQQQNQKRKDFEQKKAAVESKEKEQEGQRLLKEREAKLRLEQVEVLKKEKEQRIQKKIKEKKTKQ